MEELENTIPTPGIEPGVPSNFEGSSISGSLQPGFNQIVPYDPTLTTPGIPGGVEIQYDPNNPFDVAKQVKASPITEGDIAFQRSKGKFFQPGFEKSNFERYYDDEDNFYKLGFDPNINNEQIYNQNRSWYEDVFRSAAAVPALGISVVKSSYRSLGDMLSGDFSMTDETGAREFSQIMAESGSTRGGVSGFASNLILQSGFIAGIAADYLATEALLAGAVALSEGAALPAAVAAGTAKTAQTVRSISALFDANTARQAYNTIKAIDAAKVAQGALNLTKSAAEALIPKTLVNIKGILTAESPVIGLANTVRGVGDFVLDMKQISYATSESALEGGQVKNDFIDRHINEYIENNGKYPDQTELDRIYQLASDAGTTTGLINAPLILLTNAVTFDNLFKGGKKNLITGSDAAILEEAKLSGKVTRFVERTGKFETMTAKDAFVESIRGLKSPKTYASFAKSYFSKNLTEGLQELSQEIIAGASEDYYDRIYDTPEAGGIVTYLADAYENLKNQASAQGAEVFLSGFLMGGLAGMATGAARGGFNTLKRNYLSARNPEEYKKAIQEEDERINKIASELNDAIQNGNKIFSEPDLENLLVQVKLGEDMVKARKSFDEKVFHDLKDMSRFNSVYTALQTNKFDFVIKKIEDMKQMTGAELKEAFGLADSVTDEEARKVLDVTIDRAYQVKEQYEQFSGYKNPFNPNKYFPNTPEGITQKIQELINFRGFEEAKKTAVFSLHGLEQAKKRMTDLTKSYANIASVAELNYSDVAATLSMDSIDSEINLLNAEIEMSKDTTDPTLTKTINNKKKKLKALESLKKNLERVKDITDPTEVRKTTYLKKAFTDYMTVLTDEKGTLLTPKDINEAYRIFTDYYALNKDKADFTALLSSLYDPENFANLVQRESLLVAARNKKFKDYFTRAFKKYSETSKIGLFLKELAKKGFVIDLKYLKELDENNFNGLKNIILNDPDIKFRDLNSSKLFGTDDVRYNNIKTIIDGFENSVKPETEATIKSSAPQAGPDNSYGTQSTDDVEEGTEDIEYASDFTNNVIRRLYDDYLKGLKEADIPVSFEEFVSSKKASSVMSAISQLENSYDNIVDSTKPSFEEWLRVNSRTPLVFDILDKNNLTFSDIFIQQRDENQYITTALEEGETVVSPGYNGVFITKLVGSIEGGEGVDVYFVKVNDGTLAIDVAGKPDELVDFEIDVYTDLGKAQKAQKAIGDYLANNKKQFVFDNTPLINGQIISDSKNNEYIVLSYPSEIAAGSNLKLKNVKTGSILSVKNFTGFKLERAPIEKKAYTSRFNSTSVIDKAWGKRNKEANESQEDANIRLSNLLRDTPAEDLLKNLSIKFSNNNKSPERYAYLKLGEEKENLTFGFFTDPYTIALVYNGEEIGYLPNPTSTAFLDSQGNPIPYDRINADRVKQAFYLNNGYYNQAVADIKSSYKNKVALLNYLKSKLGKNNSIEIPYSDLKNVANVNIGLGSYEFLSRDEERPKFSQLNYNTINGGIYVIDRKNKYNNGSITTEETTITDIDFDALEETTKEINSARYNKKSADALIKYGRYVAAVKLPNGKVRFVELTTPSLSNEELNSLANSIKERIELTKKENLNEDGTAKAQEYNDIWNEENIGNKSFIALPLKDRGKFLQIYVSPNGSLVLDFVNKNSRTSPIQRKKIIDDPEFNEFPELLSLINNAIKEHDNQAKLPANKMDIILTGKSFKATLPKSIDTTQVLEMESSVGVNVVKDVSVYIDMLEPASDVQAEPLLPKVPDEILDVDISNIDFSSAPASANVNPELLRGVAPVNPPVVPVVEPVQEPKEPTQVNSAETLNKLINAQKSIPQQIKELQTKLNDKTDEIRKQLLDQRLAEKGELTVADKREIRTQAENSPEVLAIKGQIEVLEKSIGLKVVDAGYTESDITNLTEFLNWVENNLPDFISVEDLKTFKDNLYNGGKTVGAFVSSLSNIAGNVEVNGIIYTSASSPFKYHEAFHAVFRLLLNDKQISKYLAIAKKEYREQLRKEGKSFSLAKEEMRLLNPLYAAMSESQLEERMYEEYLADKFEAWKKNNKTETSYVNKSLFAKIVEFIKKIFGRYTKNELQSLFENIDAGKYRNSKVVINRFTDSPFDISEPVLKAIKIGTDIIEDSTFSAEGESNLIKVNKYLPEQEGTRLAASVAAIYNNKLKDATEETNTEDLLDSVLDNYEELYNPELDQYLDLDTATLNKLKEYKTIFTNTENRNILKEAVREHLAILNIKENNEQDASDDTIDELGERGKQNYTEGAASVGGFGSLSKFLRSFISTVTYQATDDFGNTQFLDGTPYIQSVDGSTVYNGILKAIAGSEDIYEIIEKLNLFKEKNFESGKVIEEFFTETGITFDEEGNADLSNVKNSYLFQSFIKGFGQYAIDYLFINKDIKKQVSLIISANRKDSGKVQFDQWSQAYASVYESKLTPELKAKAKLVLTGIKSAMSPTKKYTDDELIIQTNKLSTALMETVGISISPMYLAYSISNNLNTSNLTPHQLKLITLYSGVSPITIEDVDILSGLIDTGENPFINLQYETTVDPETGQITEEKEILEGGATTRLYNIAKANAIFDESVYATSWKNAEGQLVYVHQLPSYHLVKINEIKKIGGIEELLKDPFLTNNYLLKDPKFLASLDLLTVKRTDGQKVSSLTETGEGELIENKELEVNRREGTTYGSFSPEEFITSLIDLYSEGGTQKRGGLEFGMSTHLIRVLEASSTGNVINLPIIKAAAKKSGKNTLSEEAKNAILGFVEQEYNRIQRVVNGEFTDDIYDFNTGKMRGLTLFKTGKLLSEDFKNELEAQAQENLPLTEQQKEQIKNEVTKSMLQDIDFLIELLDQDNILKVKDGKVERSALVGFVTKGFTNKDKKKSTDKTKNSIYNLLKDDYRFNLLQIYVNDFINTTAINQLMHGDHAISFKDPVDEIKRAKGSNATGANIESVITDERLGIKHEFKTAHVVTISDPKFIAKFAGGKKEKADAQMWMTVKALRYTLFGLGKLSPIQAELLNKIENGETVTGDFFFGDKNKKGAVSFNAATNSIKLVYFDGQTYVKTSGFVLTKEFTSYGKNFDKALPGREELHKLRNTLEAYEADKETVSLAIPVSASKGKKINVASDVNSITDNNFIETKTKYWRLQLENPSNKIKITDPTQAKQILTAEQDDETIVNFMGKDITVGDLKKIYQNASINRVKLNYLGKRNAIFTLDSGLEEVRKSIAAGTITPKLAAFQKYAIETLKSSAGDAQMIEFFELDEQGEPKYDLNSPITIDKFVELFLSYFSKGVLSEKVPGHAVALVSDYGVKQLKKVLELDENGQPKRWEIVRVEEFKSNPSKYGTPKEYSNSENRTFTGLTKGDYYIDDLRHNVPEYDKDGNITGYFTEFIMPAHFKELLSFIKPGDKIPDAVAKMFGVRIPSQDKHSAVALKLVDFMPVYYGSSAIFPQELIEISGADFDIDKLYIAIQEWLVENGKFKAYGTGTSKTERFNQFVKYQFSKNKEFRKSYSEFYNALKKERADEIEALQDLDIDISDSDLFDEYIDKEEIIKAALQSLGLPSTKDEYDNKVQKLGYEPYQGALNNIIVNARIGLLNNSAMVTAKEGEIPKAFQVATVDPLIDIVKSFTERFPELKDQLEEGNYNIDTLLGKYYAFRNNKEGARNIGPAVNSLLVYSLLNANGTGIRKARFFVDENGDQIELSNLRFKLNGKEFDNYGETRAYNPETKNYDGERIFYILSALTSAMTDNAKERLAAKLNLNINSLGIVANMIAQGVSLEDSLLFINQPAIREFYKRLQKNKSSYAEERDRMKGQNKIIGELLEEYSIQDIPSDISTADLENGIRTNNANIQAAVLNNFKTLIAQSEAFMNVSAVLKVNKGLPKDLTEFDEIYNKAADLGIEMNDKEFENTNIPFDIRTLLNSSNNTFGFNFTVYREIKSLMSSVMLNRTPVVNRMREIIVANTEVNPKDRKNFNKNLDQNLISFFAIKAYVNLLKTGGYKRALASLNNGMVYDQTASTLPENMDNVTDVVTKLRKLRPNNYFVNKFIFAITAANRSNKDGINKVEFNNWTKLSKLQLNKIQYSFMELYTNELTRPYAIDLFHYLLVKDGGQFKSGSFIRIMPNFMFDLILKSSSSAVTALKGKANDIIVKKTFGANLNQLYNEFVKGYLQNTTTTFFTKSIKSVSKDGKVKEFKKDLDITKDVESPIQKTEDKILVNLFKNTSFEREMIPLGDVSNYKGDEFIIDENGQYQVVQPMLSLPGPSKLTDEGKKMYRYNLKYLAAAGFILQTKNDKTQIGFPLVVKSVEYVAGVRNTTYYKLVSIKRDRAEEKENLADLIQPGDQYAFGVSAEYQKFTPIGSKKQFGAGFVIPGNIPNRTDVFKDRKNKDITSNPNGIPDVNDINLELPDFDKILSNIDMSKAPVNTMESLASKGISVKVEGKSIKYEKDGKPFETSAKSPEELAKTLTPKAVEVTEENFDNIDLLVASAPAMAFDPSIGANIKAQAEYPTLNNFYMEQLSDEQREKIKEGMGIKTFVNFVQQYKEFVNTIGGDQNSFVEQIKKCYL